MKTLLQLQALDLKIEKCKEQEKEIPKQKKKFDIHRERLHAELKASEERCQALKLEQRECEGEIEQKQQQIAKYDTQLLAVKKNEEYQALLGEMDTLKKQISLKEERILAIMLEIDDANALFEEDKTRIADELSGIEDECKKIDAELAAALQERKGYEGQRAPLLEAMDPSLLSRYQRIRKAIKKGAAVVPLKGETCSGCFMMITPQVVNEVMEGKKVHSCSHCGRILYDPLNFMDESSPEVM